MSKCVQPVVLGDEVGKRAQTGNGKQAKRQNLHQSASVGFLNGLSNLDRR